MSNTEDLWSDRLEETSIPLGRDVHVDTLGDRYDVDDLETITQLTNEALQVVIDSGLGGIHLEDLDEAAHRLGVIDR